MSPKVHPIMYDTLDYSYESEDRHLNDDEVLESYKKAKAQKPNAIVILDSLNCGHWDIDVYETPEQKEAYYRKSISALLSKFRTKFSK